MTSIKAGIFGCSGTELTNEEFEFFQEVNPFGFILFKRNCEDSLQISALIDHLKETVKREDIPILIDQEGGRVSRLTPPHWPYFPPALYFGRLWKEESPEEAWDSAYENAFAMGTLLREEGITVNCAPILDLLFEETHQVIGDRSFGNDSEMVAYLGIAFIKGFLRAGILPIIKHLPGHGRAQCDSHLELPVVSATIEELRDKDFKPFRNVVSQFNNIWGMTAHILYKELDSENPATQSSKVINEIIRQEIGFKGILISDDIGMKALKGSFSERTEKLFKAGCDLALHCSSNISEMQEVSKALPELPIKILKKWENRFQESKKSIEN